VAEFVPFTAQTRLSGANLADGTEVRKGASDALLAHVGVKPDRALVRSAEGIATSGGTPLVVARAGRVLGVVHLKDIIKPGIRERFAELRAMGIRAPGSRGWRASRSPRRWCAGRRNSR
jgi:potassium-transporting ATPase ATP-binding subunit